MNKFEKLKKMTLEELVDWIIENIDNADPHQTNLPWDKEFNEVCNKCELIQEKTDFGEFNVTYCEKNNTCKYFNDCDMNEEFRKNIIRSWLEK